MFVFTVVHTSGSDLSEHVVYKVVVDQTSVTIASVYLEPTTALFTSSFTSIISHLYSPFISCVCLCLSRHITSGREGTILILGEGLQ